MTGFHTGVLHVYKGNVSFCANEASVACRLYVSVDGVAVVQSMGTWLGNRRVRPKYEVWSGSWRGASLPPGHQNPKLLQGRCVDCVEWQIIKVMHVGGELFSDYVGFGVKQRIVMLWWPAILAVTATYLYVLRSAFMMMLVCISWSAVKTSLDLWLQLNWMFKNYIRLGVEFRLLCLVQFKDL